MVYICTKFHEHILNGFRVMERTQFQYFFIIKGHNSVNIAHRVIVFVFCTASDHDLHL